MRVYVIVDYESYTSRPENFTILTTAYKDYEAATKDFQNIVCHIKDDYNNAWIDYDGDDIFRMTSDDYVRFIRLDVLNM